MMKIYQLHIVNTKCDRTLVQTCPIRYRSVLKLVRARTEIRSATIFFWSERARKARIEFGTDGRVWIYQFKSKKFIFPSKRMPWRNGPGSDSDRTCVKEPLWLIYALPLKNNIYILISCIIKNILMITRFIF